MLFTDTHTHLFLRDFDKDREVVIKRACNVGVTKMFLPNINSRTIKKLLYVEKTYPENCFAMMGIHPCYVKENIKDEIRLVKEWHSKRSFIGVGEIGLDFYRDLTFVEEQKWAFKQQLLLAKELDLPVSIHCRNAFNEILICFDELNLKSIKGVFHCFTGNLSDAHKIIKYGLKLGLGGVLTFKNSSLDLVVKSLSLENFVLETDSPYLTPTPYRGKRNESAYITLIVEKLCAILNCSEKKISTITQQNVFSVFGL